MGEYQNKVEGNIKTVAGKVSGDQSLEAEGEGQKVVGNVQEGARKVAGKVEETIGKLSGREGRKA